MGKTKTMSVKYEDGPLRRDIPSLGVSCERGEVITVDAEVGEQLIAQGWIKGTARKKSSSKKPTKKSPASSQSSKPPVEDTATTEAAAGEPAETSKE